MFGEGGEGFARLGGLKPFAEHLAFALYDLHDGVGIAHQLFRGDPCAEWSLAQRQRGGQRGGAYFVARQGGVGAGRSVLDDAPTVSGDDL